MILNKKLKAKNILVLVIKHALNISQKVMASNLQKMEDLKVQILKIPRYEIVEPKIQDLIKVNR